MNDDIEEAFVPETWIGKQLLQARLQRDTHF